MKLTLFSRKILHDIPSASGIEVVGDSMYMIGDDSPWLFRLNEKYEVAEKLPIGDVDAAVGGKIPKPIKPDLEAMAVWERGLDKELILFGSGSKSPQRDMLVRINAEIPHMVKIYSLVQFYDTLCVAAKLIRDELNIEAAVIVEENLFLFNRGKNRIFKLNMQELLVHAESRSPAPIPEIFCVTLPSLNGIEAGFSGATFSPDGKQILFTASIENTPNWIDDGEILGSFVGYFPLDKLKDSFIPDCIAVADADNKILKIKVESIAVHHLVSANNLHLLLVTDNDSSSSELIEAELSW